MEDNCYWNIFLGRFCITAFSLFSENTTIRLGFSSVPATAAFPCVSGFQASDLVPNLRVSPAARGSRMRRERFGRRGRRPTAGGARPRARSLAGLRAAHALEPTAALGRGPRGSSVSCSCPCRRLLTFFERHWFEG